MKPRLDPPDFTTEDKIIWCRMYRLEPFTHLVFAGCYAESDRRDADLMLQGVQGYRCLWRPADDVCGWVTDVFYGWDLPI